jgi:hypothetical protein
MSVCSDLQGRLDSWKAARQVVRQADSRIPVTNLKTQEAVIDHSPRPSVSNGRQFKTHSGLLPN